MKSAVVQCFQVCSLLEGMCNFFQFFRRELRNGFKEMLVELAFFEAGHEIRGNQIVHHRDSPFTYQIPLAGYYSVERLSSDVSRHR